MWLGHVSANDRPEKGHACADYYVDVSRSVRGKQLFIYGTYRPWSNVALPGVDDEMSLKLSAPPTRSLRYVQGWAE